MNLKFFSDPSDAENFEPFPLVFSRGSVAYEGNGASLEVNQPGFIEGSKGVYGLGVYEQYTNLVPAKISDMEQGFINNIDYSITGDIQITQPYIYGKYNGSRTFAVRPTTETGNKYFQLRNFPILPNTQYSWAIEFYTPEDVYIVPFYCGIQEVSNPWRIIARSSNNLSPVLFKKGYHVLNGTSTTPSDWGGTSMITLLPPLKKDDFDLHDTNTTLYFDGLRVYQKGYNLPWILGGTTRQPESCYIPVEEVKKFLNIKNHSIEILMHSTPGFRENNGDKVLLNHRTLSQNKNSIIILKSNSFVIFRTSNDGSELHQRFVPHSQLENDLNAFSYHNTLKDSVCVLNNNVSPRVDNQRLPDFIGDIQIGGVTGASISNSLIRQIVFNLPRPISELENRQKFAKENGYFPIDDKVTAFLDLESGLRAYRRTTQ